MNLFTQYGIKEVANVMIYSIIRIGDEEVYIPVLHLDSLKISNIEKKEQKVSASSGYGNTKRISWSFGREINLKMQDALFTPASLSMCWGGWLEGKLQCAALAIAKISVRNKYFNNNYSIYAYPSPELTSEEWELIYEVAGEEGEYTVNNYIKNSPNIEKNRVELHKDYYRKEIHNVKWNNIVENLIEKILFDKTLISTRFKGTETLDRTEECIVQDNDFIIDIAEQKGNYQKFLINDYSSTFVLYLDPKTMSPLYLGRDSIEDKQLVLKPGTKYLKYVRQEYIPNRLSGTSYGKTLTVSADTFPNYYRIVGETRIREQVTGQDQRLQFIIPKAKLSGDTNIKLEATGEPTIFDMNVEVICPENDIMFELKQYNVEDDCTHGGTHIIPQLNDYTKTKIYSPNVEEEIVEKNMEIY